MKKLNVLVDWCDKNYSAFINEDVDVKSYNNDNSNCYFCNI